MLRKHARANQFLSSIVYTLTSLKMRGFLITAGLLAVATAATNSNCTDGLYMIVARGTGEPATAGPNGEFPANTGSPGYVAQLISGKIKNSKIIGVEFAASGDSVKDYVKSENDGAAAMLKLANEYHSSCPDSKMALLGYSQVCESKVWIADGDANPRNIRVLK